MGSETPEILSFNLVNAANITYMGSKITVLSLNLVNAANVTYMRGKRPKFCPLIWLMVPASLHGKLSAKSVKLVK